MRITDILSLNAVKVPLASVDKRAIIDELVDTLTTAGLCSDADGVKRAVWERESQRSTGIGEGLAIPHGKCGGTQGLVLAMGKPAQPIEFGSIDKKPVQLVILLVSPPEKKDEHIQALGKISKIMTSPEFRHKAYSATTPLELYQLFRDADA
jgi:mannitol/fructose-specific phosphotransferase system IIA component (Ntr-type)